MERASDLLQSGFKVAVPAPSPLPLGRYMQDCKPTKPDSEKYCDNCRELEGLHPNAVGMQGCAEHAYCSDCDNWRFWFFRKLEVVWVFERLFGEGLPKIGKRTGKMIQQSLVYEWSSPCPTCRPRAYRAYKQEVALGGREAAREHREKQQGKNKKKIIEEG